MLQKFSVVKQLKHDVTTHKKRTTQNGVTALYKAASLILN